MKQNLINSLLAVLIFTQAPSAQAMGLMAESFRSMGDDAATALLSVTLITCPPLFTTFLVWALDHQVIQNIKEDAKSFALTGQATPLVQEILKQSRQDQRLADLSDLDIMETLVDRLDQLTEKN